MTAALNALLLLIHAIDWLDVKAQADRTGVRAFFDDQFGDPAEIALSAAPVGHGRAQIPSWSFLSQCGHQSIPDMDRGTDRRWPAAGK
jgi:hypothetical protein